MPISPTKNVTYITNATVNKGVQAREIDIANVRLDTDALSFSRAATESSEWPTDMWGCRAGIAGVGEVPGRRDGTMAAGDAPSAPTPLTPPSTDHSVSYVQLFSIHKSESVSAGGGSKAKTIRCPRPHCIQPSACRDRKPDVAGQDLNFYNIVFGLRESQDSCLILRFKISFNIAAVESSAAPAAILLACPAFAALHQQPWDKARGILEAGSRGMQAASTDARTFAGHDMVGQNEINKEKVKNQNFWEKVHSSYKHDADDYDDGPDCMEVYEFDHGNEALVARGSGPVSYIEHGARRASRPASALLAEILAVPRLALSVPVHIALQLQRCVLLGVREAVTGVVQTTADTLVKPLLALAFNAVLRPPLVCVAQSAQALREALRPLTLAMSDALEPLARLLAAVRLVQINRHCTCACAHHV